MGADYRLLVVSSRARNKVAIFNSVLPNLVLVDYNYEMTTLDELLSVWFSKKYLCSQNQGGLQFTKVSGYLDIRIPHLYVSYKTIPRVSQKIRKSLSGTKVVSVAMVLHTSERELFICGPGPAFISLKALISNPSMKDFLLEIAKNVLDLVS